MRVLRDDRSELAAGYSLGLPETSRPRTVLELDGPAARLADGTSDRRHRLALTVNGVDMAPLRAD